MTGSVTDRVPVGIRPMRRARYASRLHKGGPQMMLLRMCVLIAVWVCSDLLGGLSTEAHERAPMGTGQKHRVVDAA